MRIMDRCNHASAVLLSRHLTWINIDTILWANDLGWKVMRLGRPLQSIASQYHSATWGLYIKKRPLLSLTC